MLKVVIYTFTNECQLEETIPLVNDKFVIYIDDICRNMQCALIIILFYDENISTIKFTDYCSFQYFHPWKLYWNENNANMINYSQNCCIRNKITPSTSVKNVSALYLFSKLPYNILFRNYGIMYLLIIGANKNKR